ncbi:hypothetical protein CAEBREN_09134 [Caenorhabditis brenneri]|uniref:Uncharacterized protein n=1 Tax=Caenorhabditis brenneri TaxID=135651 RepID=G0MMQ4_CAEBE|nr:hypothetical protein CAEBREN_09134 [Caenorhabditis brenneri]
MSEESSSRKKTKMTGIGDAADEDPSNKAPTDPRLAQRDPGPAPTDPRLAPTDPKLAQTGTISKKTEEGKGASMPDSSNGNITIRKRVHRSEDAPTSDQVASQIDPPIAPTTIQNTCQSGTGQLASKEKDKNSEIEDLKAQVQYWKDQADLAERLSKNNCQLSSTNVEQQRLIGSLQMENSLLKTTNEKLEKDLATEKEDNAKMKIEMAVAKKEKDLMEKTDRDRTQQLEDVKKMLSGSKVNEAKMEGKVEVLNAEKKEASERVLQLYSEKEVLTEQLKESKKKEKLAAESQKSRVALEEELAKLQLDVNKHMSEKKEIREEKVKLREKYEALKKEKRSAWEFWGVAPRNVVGTLSNGGSDTMAVKTNDAQQIAPDEFSLKLEAVRNAHQDQVNALQNDFNKLNMSHEEEKRTMEELHRDQLATLQNRAKKEEEKKLEKEQEIMKDDLQKEIENLMEGSVPAEFGKKVDGEEGESGTN